MFATDTFMQLNSLPIEHRDTNDLDNILMQTQYEDDPDAFDYISDYDWALDNSEDLYA